VCLGLASKKLRLLEKLESDDGDGDGSTNSSGDDDTSTFRIMQKVAAYLGPTVLMEDKKMSAMLCWGHHANTYPNLSSIAKVYLTFSASSVLVESMFSVAGLVKNSRRSAISPHHLNRVCFVHDNFAEFFSD